MKTPSLIRLLKHCKYAISNPIPRSIRPNNNTRYIFRSDASNIVWGPQLVLQDKEIACCAQVWSTKEKRLHNTHREALASARGVQYLERYLKQGFYLQKEADAISILWYWRKGSKILNMNSAIAHMVHGLNKRAIFIQALHISEIINTRADWL